MRKANINEEFIKEVSVIHNNFYSYHKTNYINSKTKVIISCPIHGDFSQAPYSHKNGSGCPKCGREKCDKNRKVWSEESFREKVYEIQPDLIFNKTVYVNPKVKVLYECPIHGEKRTLPYNLLKGCGCRQCGSSKPKITKREWLGRFKDCNCGNISYNDVPESFNAEELISFICDVHGKFNQTPLHHIKSCCPKCGFDRTIKYHQENPVGWSYRNWIKTAEKSKNFDSFKVYIIRCWNETEEFFKIGRTFQTVKKRFGKQKSAKIKYNYEVVHIFEGEAREICELEDRLKRENKENKYLPIKDFNGKYECFSKIIE